jgi:hypothetical protein
MLDTPAITTAKKLQIDEIAMVCVVTKDGGMYGCECPHCGEFVALEGEDTSEIRDEQFSHRRCGGTFEVAHNARFRRST